MSSYNVLLVETTVSKSLSSRFQASSTNSNKHRSTWRSSGRWGYNSFAQGLYGAMKRTKSKITSTFENEVQARRSHGIVEITNVSGASI